MELPDELVLPGGAAARAAGGRLAARPRAVPRRRTCRSGRTTPRTSASRRRASGSPGASSCARTDEVGASSSSVGGGRVGTVGLGTAERRPVPVLRVPAGGPRARAGDGGGRVPLDAAGPWTHGADEVNARRWSATTASERVLERASFRRRSTRGASPTACSDPVVLRRRAHNLLSSNLRNRRLRSSDDHRGIRPTVRRLDRRPAGGGDPRRGAHRGARPGGPALARAGGRRLPRRDDDLPRAGRRGRTRGAGAARPRRPAR